MSLQNFTQKEIELQSKIKTLFERNRYPRAAWHPHWTTYSPNRHTFRPYRTTFSPYRPSFNPYRRTFSPYRPTFRPYYRRWTSGPWGRRPWGRRVDPPWFTRTTKPPIFINQEPKTTMKPIWDIETTRWHRKRGSIFGSEVARQWRTTMAPIFSGVTKRPFWFRFYMRTERRPPIFKKLPGEPTTSEEIAQQKKEGYYFNPTPPSPFYTEVGKCMMRL